MQFHLCWANQHAVSSNGGQTMLIMQSNLCWANHVDNRVTEHENKDPVWHNTSLNVIVQRKKK